LNLPPEALVIADKTGPQALAGIMGGAAAAVLPETSEIFLECAYFAPEYLLGKPRQYGIHTESSHRFERGVDPAQMQAALDLATELLVQLCGASAGPLSETVSSQYVPLPRQVTVPVSHLKQYLGISLSVPEIIDILGRLGLTATVLKDIVTVDVPTRRSDLQLPMDILEELARIYGYDHIPATLPCTTVTAVKQPESTLSWIRQREFWADRGYHEAIHYSFMDPKWHALFFPNHIAPTVLNPISAELSVMRRSLLPALLKSVQYNLNRQQDRVRFFELGTAFFTEGSEVLEHSLLALVAAGSVFPEQWKSSAGIDFYTFKSDIEAWFAVLRQPVTFCPQSEIAYLHPGQSARLDSAGVTIGYCGALHPQFQQWLDIKQTIYVCEMNLSNSVQLPLSVFSTPSKYPLVRRDLALVVDLGVTYQDIENCVRSLGSEYLQHMVVFDLYMGKDLGQNKRSVAIGLILQAMSHTLTDSEVDAYIHTVIQQLAKQLGVHLRE